MTKESVLIFLAVILLKGHHDDDDGGGEGVDGGVGVGGEDGGWG